MALLLPAFLLSLLLVGCDVLPGAEDYAGGASSSSVQSQQSSSSLLTEEELVTRNVTYTGLLEEGGATIYQQGTHRLALNDGKMVLLQSAEGVSLPLDLYVGKLVRVRGDVQPTVEADGTIMAVSEIRWIRRESDETGKEIEVEHVLCGGGAGAGCPEGLTCVLEEDVAICRKESEEAGMASESSAASASSEASSAVQLASSSSPAAQSSPATSSSIVASSSATAQTSSSSVSSSAVSSSSSANAEGMSADVTLMAKENLAPERWTQRYCSSHVGFCIPVHKNWYFKSFGATASLLWHVEIGPHAVENVSDGPLVVDLKSGDLASVSAEDNAVKTVGSRVVGYRAWSDNRHFEISGDAALQAAVTAVTQGLRPAE